MTFEEIIHQDKPTLVDFFATWCGPCQMLVPVLQEVKSKMENKINILKIDVDKNPQALNIYQVRSVPTLILFRRGEVVWRKSGIVSADELEKLINNSH